MKLNWILVVSRMTLSYHIILIRTGSPAQGTDPSWCANLATKAIFISCYTVRCKQWISCAGTIYSTSASRDGLIVTPTSFFISKSHRCFTRCTNEPFGFLELSVPSSTRITWQLLRKYDSTAQQVVLKWTHLYFAGSNGYWKQTMVQFCYLHDKGDQCWSSMFQWRLLVGSVINSPPFMIAVLLISLCMFLESLFV